MNVGRPALSNLLNGKTKLTSTMASKIEKAFGVKWQTLLQRQVEISATEDDENNDQVASKKYVPQFLNITARDIEMWVEKGHISPRQLMAVFLRKLVMSTASDFVVTIDFPAYDLSEKPGWDGTLTTTKRTPWIPKGNSCWEFGCNEKPGAKAESDYKSRTEKTPVSERKKTTFVFVTPRYWPDKADWVNRKQGLGDWANVLALDAKDLEHWVEQSITGQAWMAEQLGRDRQGVTTPDELERIWSGVTTPPLPTALFKSAIERNRDKILEWLENPPTAPLTLISDSVEEGKAYVAALFASPGFENYASNLLAFENADALILVESFLALMLFLQSVIPLPLTTLTTSLRLPRLFCLKAIQFLSLTRIIQ